MARSLAQSESEKAGMAKRMAAEARRTASFVARVASTDRDLHDLQAEWGREARLLAGQATPVTRPRAP